MKGRTKQLLDIQISRRTALSALVAGAVGAPAPTDGHAQSNQENTFPLVLTADSLIELLAESGSAIRLLDASPLREYRNGHLPGATHVFWEDTIDANYPVYGAVVTQGFEQQQRLDVISRFGVRPEEQIVVYDRDIGFRAARVVWFVRFLGFPFTSILDGGYSAWSGLNGNVESGMHKPPKIVPEVNPAEGFYVVTEALQQRLELANSQIVDVRTDDERQDTLDGQIPLGQIPGSRRLPWDSLIDPASNFLIPIDAILQKLETAGVSTDSDIIIVARFGVEAAFAWTALRNVGLDNILTYDRGWVEWASTPGLPVESIVS